MPTWTDRFRTPDAQTLLAEVPEPHATPLSVASDWLDRVDGFDCETRWMGVPWRWTLVYQEDGRDAIYLIPDPAAPRVAMQIGVNSLDEADLKRLSRPVRDGLGRARVVGNAVWAEWDVAGSSIESTLDELVNRVWRDAAMA